MKVFKKLLALPFLLLIWLYRMCISPLLPPSCRFYPTCSTYALEALKKYGPIKGLGLIAWRIIRCNPWNPGGYDPLQ